MIARQHGSINRQALFADETLDYRCPEEPDAGEEVSFRFRTAKGDADCVFFIEEDKNVKAEMRKADSDDLFDFYEYVSVAGEEPQFYYFQVVKGEESCCFNRLGVTDDVQRCYGFCITPGFHTPEWAKGAVMYQIFVDRFCRGDGSNDVQSGEYIYIGKPVRHVEDWEQNPATMDVGCFYGGDLQGVWDKLDYLQELGVEVIYFNPLFVSPSNHKYDTQDYDHIDPHYGRIVKDGGELLHMESGANDGREPLGMGAVTNSGATRYQIRSADPANLEASDQFFASFVEEVHRRGMKVIMDGVFNHCGSFNKWLDREKIYVGQGGYEPGAYLSGDSPYHSFFKFHDGEGWPDNDSYDGWWGHDTLPKLNYEESPKLVDYIMGIARKWVSKPFCADGWRLDVAADLGYKSEFNHHFWRLFRQNVKEANPEALILAEHYGDPSSWLQGDQWDTVMNYDAFMEPLTWFLTGMEKHSDEYNEAVYGDGSAFFNAMNYHMSRMQSQSVMVAMNQLSNHDHSRFLTRTNRIVGRIGTVGPERASENVDVSVLREAVMVQMTWPGAPTLYYGDEAGVCGWTDPDSRRTYPWGKEDSDLIAYHRHLIALHKKLPALRRGSVKALLADRQLIAYGRMRGSNRCVVVIHNHTEGRSVEMPVWELGINNGQTLTRVMLSTADGFDAERVEFPVEHGMLCLELPAKTALLLTVGEE